jgi:hypothetical protein
MYKTMEDTERAGTALAINAIFFYFYLARTSFTTSRTTRAAHPKNQQQKVLMEFHPLICRKKKVYKEVEGS